MTRVTKVSTDIVQWLVRNSFEEAFIAANPYQGQSKANPKYGAWFDAWLESEARAMLVANGVISGSEDWR